MLSALASSGGILGEEDGEERGGVGRGEGEEGGGGSGGEGRERSSSITGRVRTCSGIVLVLVKESKSENCLSEI